MQHRECERDLSGAIPDEAGLWIVPDAMSLANSIGIDRKGTRPPLKTDSPNTLSSTFGGTLAEPWLFGHVLAVKAPNPPLCPIQPEAICYHVVTI